MKVESLNDKNDITWKASERQLSVNIRKCRDFSKTGGLWVVNYDIRSETCDELIVLKQNKEIFRVVTRALVFALIFSPIRRKIFGRGVIVDKQMYPVFPLSTLLKTLKFTLWNIQTFAMN